MTSSVDLTLAGKLDEVPHTSLEIEQFMRAAGFLDPQILDMQLAVEEAVTNTIRHGYRGSPGPITIHGEAGPDCLTVEIADCAPAFDPLGVPAPDVTTPLAERKTGGLGIYLILQVTDAVAYRYEQGKNILVLTKKKQKNGI